MTGDTETLQLAERLMAALEACDVDTVRALYEPDAKIWHNFDRALQPLDEHLQSLQWMHRKLSDMRYDIVRREAIPDGFYQEHVLCGKLASGEDFSMPACAIIKVREGRIVALNEYLDSAQTRPLLSKATAA
jgi:ketosteroid isomerase-like protein